MSQNINTSQAAKIFHMYSSIPKPNSRKNLISSFIHELLRKKNIWEDRFQTSANLSSYHRTLKYQAPMLCKWLLLIFFSLKKRYSEPKPLHHLQMTVFPQNSHCKIEWNLKNCFRKLNQKQILTIHLNPFSLPGHEEPGDFDMWVLAKLCSGPPEVFFSPLTPIQFSLLLCVSAGLNRRFLQACFQVKITVREAELLS